MNRVRTADRTARIVLTASAALVALVIAAILLFVGSEGLRLFLDVSPFEFFFGLTWNPPLGRYGALPFLVGSLAATAIALLIGAPLGLAGAIFMAKISPPWMRAVLRQASNLFVGIPSVVYGYIGMTLLVPWVREHLGGQGFGVLVAGAILAIMVMPTILGVSEDALRAVDPALEEGSLGLGATRWQTIWLVTLPAARPRILAAIILAFARAFGETTAVQMVIGNSPVLVRSLTHGTATLTSQIIMEMGQTPPGSPWNRALFMMAFGLLMVSLLMILLVRWVSNRGVVR
ncbi:phosphate transport system permease protein [Symbiobacterium terraclitae]|uniref:Phosphate transport system permease protein n=1 Tax=Symbiobacterium terraclitae TaxID=557451 RepID=A0ABS4JX70_9FIRM|nr:phosphate transport system permease protein [Symbiobacterium terraclitae]